MKTKNILCKPRYKSYEEYSNKITIFILLFLLIASSIYLSYQTVKKKPLYSFEASVVLIASITINLLFWILYYNWAQSYQCSTIITEDGIYISRENMKPKYKKIYRKGYFVLWSEITKMALLNQKDSGWKCTFTTKYGDAIEISSPLKYPDTCISQMEKLGNRLKENGVEVIIAKNILLHSKTENEHKEDKDAK